MQNILNIFSKIVNITIGYWHRLSIRAKFLLTTIFSLFILPHLLIFIIYHTIYAAPMQKYFDVTDRQILTIKENDMYLTNFYLCNSKNYQPFSNSTKKNYGSNMCGEDVLIMENVKADDGLLSQGYFLPKNFSTAILPGNKVVWGYNDNPEYFEVNLSEVTRNTNNEYKINTKSILKLEKFDLGTYADKLKNGKQVPPLSTIQKQTGAIWTKPFLVENNSIVFYDATITKIDHEKPIEAMSRRISINAETGNIMWEESERENLDLKFYTERQRNYGNETFNWDYMSEKNNWSFGLFVTKNFYPFYQYINNQNYLYYSPNLQVQKHYTKKYESPNCDDSMFPLPCSEWLHNSLTINSKKFDKQYTFRTGTILYFNLEGMGQGHTPIHGVNNFRATSQNEEFVSFYNGYDSYVYLMDLKTGGKIKLGDSDLRIIFIK